MLVLLLLTSDDGGHVQDGQIVGTVRHGAACVAVVDALHVGKERRGGIIVDWPFVDYRGGLTSTLKVIATELLIVIL